MKGQHLLMANGTEAVLNSSQMSNDIWQYDSLFISIGRMPFLTPTPDNAHSLFALLTTPGFYSHHVEGVD